MKLATLVYLRKDGQTLMMHRGRKPGDVHAGKWNGLGGKLEQGETPEACAIREIREESGLELRNPQLRGILTFPLFKDNEDWYVYVFTGTDFSGDLMPDSPEGALEWIDTDKILSLPLWEGDKIFIPLLDTPGIFSGSFSYVDKKLVDHSMIIHG